MDMPRVEFALGSEVSAGHLFKSSFARAFISNRRDSKSLEASRGGGANGNYYSLVNFAGDAAAAAGLAGPDVWGDGQSFKAMGAAANPSEVERLRKKCQMLTEENEMLQESLRNQPAQEFDNTYLQAQVEMLQWQLKQGEASRHMYRSVMEQIAIFLERARKSLDIIHKRSKAASRHNLAKDKSRVPRSRSVHAVHGDSEHAATTSSSCASSTVSSLSSSSSGSSTSRFGRAKSVAQIAPVGNTSPGSSSSSSGGGGGGGRMALRDFTWSMLKRNDTPPRTKPPPPPISTSAQELNKPQESFGYRRPKQAEIDPDEVPPERLSQEAFRLLRTVQSLLLTREPDLARLSSDGGSSPSPQLDNVSSDLASLSPSQSSTFANSTTLQEAATPSPSSGCSGSERGSSCTDDEANRTVFAGSGQASTVSTLTRQSVEAAGSYKNAVEEDAPSRPASYVGSAKLDAPQTGAGSYQQPQVSASTPHNRRVRKTDKKDVHLKSLRDWALGNSGGSVSSRPQPATSVSSAEDESGFSSLSSFQEVGLPNVPLSPIKGCHTEVGLPDVPLDKVRHRRWSSTPAEFQALFKRHSGSFASGGQTNTDSLSVWV